MNLRFKNRIALYNTAAAAVTTLLVFIVVYSVVYLTAFHHLDDQIRNEKEEVLLTMHWKGDSLILNMMPEFEEQEHSQADVSPTFLQVVDEKGQVIFRSANLQNENLLFADSLEHEAFFNVEFNGKLIRQGQFPLFNDIGSLVGQLDVGISQVESTQILSNLRLTLCLAFPLILAIFFLVTSWAASRGIAPVNNLIRATRLIGDSNITSRLPLPSNKDEIYRLGSTINDLLGRIEVSLNREKQITADISHELRTPITSIRGTLEVLIRKTREPRHYEEKIIQVLNEVDILNKIIDQLLQLSRLDAGNIPVNKSAVDLSQLLHSVHLRWQQRLNMKNITMQIHVDENIRVHADSGFLEIMIENLVSNAAKYCGENGLLLCSWSHSGNSLSVTDNGPGIPEEQLPYLFNRFYRTDVSRSSRVQGNGLGLSIVKNLADLQQISIRVSSKINEGTTFILGFRS